MSRFIPGPSAGCASRASKFGLHAEIKIGIVAARI
jgi:hypothetical protein